MVGPDGDLTSRQFSTGLKIIINQNGKGQEGLQKGNGKQFKKAINYKAGQRSIVGVSAVGAVDVCPSAERLGPFHRRIIAVM